MKSFGVVFGQLAILLSWRELAFSSLVSSMPHPAEMQGWFATSSDRQTTLSYWCRLFFSFSFSLEKCLHQTSLTPWCRRRFYCAHLMRFPGISEAVLPLCNGCKSTFYQFSPSLLVASTHPNVHPLPASRYHSLYGRPFSYAPRTRGWTLLQKRKIDLCQTS